MKDMVGFRTILKSYLRYVYAILAVSLAVLLRYALVPLIGPGLPYVTLFPATVSVALLAGLGPAILTGIIGALAADYLFIPPVYSISLTPEHLSRLAIVTLTSAFVGYVGDRLRSARLKAERQALALEKAHSELELRVLERTSELVRANEDLEEEIVERWKAEERIYRLNRLYSVLSKVNEAIVRIHDPNRLYEQLCHIAVDDGLLKMAWIGLTNPATGRVEVAASFGDAGGYLNDINIYAADVPEGRGPTGKAAFKGNYSICSDIENDPRMLPWRDRALRHGFRSSAAFPLRMGTASVGAFTIYSDKPQFFTDEEIRLLSSLAEDVSFAIESMANEKKRMEAEEALREANSYNRSLIEASLDPLVTIDAGGKITDVNAATETVTGHSREELIGTDFSDYFTQPDKARAGYQQVFSEGLVQDYPLEIRHRDGHVTPVLYNAAVYRDEAGKVIGIFAAARDITERRSAEERLKQANAYNRSLLEASLDPLVTIDSGGRITDANIATENVTGHSREELIGTDFSEYFTQPDKARAGYRQVFNQGLVKDFSLEIRHRDGHITPVLYNASTYHDRTGKVLGVFAAARDITERRESERRNTAVNSLLKLYTRKFVQKEYLDAAVELIREWSGCLNTGIRIPDGNGNIPFQACTGYNAAFLKKETVLSLEEDLCLCTRVIAGAPQSQELGFVTPNGSFYFNNTAAFGEGLTKEQRTQYRGICMQSGFKSLAIIPVRYQDETVGAIHLADEREDMVPLDRVEFIEQLAFIMGEALFRFGIEKELQKLNRELEQRVADRTAQLEAANRELEAFSYSVSHDLRAPLRSIDGFSQALLEDYGEKIDSQGKDFLHRVRSGSQRMAQLIDDLLNLSRVTRTDMNMGRVSLSDLAHKVAGEVRDMQPDRKVDFIIAEGITAEGDDKLLYLVLQNLLSNAWKFTGTNPEARIEFGTFRFGAQNSDHGIPSTDGIEQGETVYYVRDNGIGFDMVYSAKLGTPFQRLHSVSEYPGTGIGLATVKRIIHRHGGSLWMEGVVGKGATAYFTL